MVTIKTNQALLLLEMDRSKKSPLGIDGLRVNTLDHQSFISKDSLCLACGKLYVYLRQVRHKYAFGICKVPKVSSFSASASPHQNLYSKFVYHTVLKDSISVQERSSSECAIVQGSLGRQCAHIHFRWARFIFKKKNNLLTQNLIQ